ncbi:hypothetical protein, partial [Fictibacillus fluitans]
EPPIGGSWFFVLLVEMARCGTLVYHNRRLASKFQFSASKLSKQDSKCSILASKLAISACIWFKGIKRLAITAVFISYL